MNIFQKFPLPTSIATIALTGLAHTAPAEATILKTEVATVNKLELPVAERLTNLSEDKFQFVAQAAPTPTPTPTPTQPERPVPHRGGPGPNGRREIVPPPVSPAAFNHTSISAYSNIG